MKTDNNDSDEDKLRSEYEIGALKEGVRGKYLHRYRAETSLALLTPVGQSRRAASRTEFAKIVQEIGKS